MGGFIGLDSGTEHFLSIHYPIYNYYPTHLGEQL